MISPWLSMEGRCVTLLLSSIPPRSTALEKQTSIRSSLSRIQLTASCPALDTPCSPADFSVSVPRIAICWGPPGASWSPHFSPLTPEEEKSKVDFAEARRAMDRQCHCCGSGAGIPPAGLWCTETLDKRCVVQESEISLGYYCKGQRDKLEQRAGQILSYRGSAGSRTFSARVGLISNQLGVKKKLFGVPGEMELTCLIQAFYFNYKETKFSLVLFRDEPEVVLQIDILYLDFQKTFTEVPFLNLPC